MPHKVPTQIMAQHLECERHKLQDDTGYQAIAGYLWSYQVSRSGWDDFAAKIDSATRGVMAEIFQDCRCNGFYDPRAIMRRGKKEIVFAQLVDRDRTIPLDERLKPDLCMLCEKKTCGAIDIQGNPKQAKDFCWRKEGRG